MTTTDKLSSRKQSADRVEQACALLEPDLWGSDLLAAAKAARPYTVKEARELHVTQVGKVAAALDAPGNRGRVGEVHAPMPIMLGADLDLALRREGPQSRVHVRAVPWEIIAGDVGQRQANENHRQTLEGLASRGGLDATEALAIILGLPWRKSLHDEPICHRLLYSMTSLYRRGALAGRAALATPAGTASEVHP